MVILYCNDCKLYLPKNSSHCSICNRCYINYDFHTFFIDLCICKNNEKIYISYLLILMTSSSLLMILTILAYSYQ